MRRVFLDIGANTGRTLLEVTRPEYAFDIIYAFEPMPKEFAHLKRIFGALPRIDLRNYGLSSNSLPTLLYGNNEGMEASIYSAKQDVDAGVSTAVDMVEASKFFREEIGTDDAVCVNMNCEGAEFGILDNLLDSGEIAKVGELMIEFHVEMLPELRLEKLRILSRFREIGFTRFSLAEKVMIGTSHPARIRNWLRGAGWWKG